MNIFVSNLGFHLESEDLKGYFAAYGEVSSAKVVTDRDTNKSKGFGFVEMTNDSEGEKAIKELNGSMVDGRSMKVDVARPREQKSERRNYFN